MFRKNLKNCCCKTTFTVKSQLWYLSDFTDESTDEETESESDTKNEEVQDSTSETDNIKANLEDIISEEKNQGDAHRNKEEEEELKTKPIVKGG